MYIYRLSLCLWQEVTYYAAFLIFSTPVRYKSLSLLASRRSASLFKTVSPNILISCALDQEVQLSLYWSLVAVGEQHVSYQPLWLGCVH